MISIEQVTKSYKDEPILTNISLTFEQAQTHVLLGSSGCGKSTLLRIILGLIEADSGLVKLGDFVACPESQHEIALMTGYVSQSGGLFPHLSARHNVELQSKILGWPSPKRKARVAELVDLLSIEPSLLKKTPDELSGGQRQKVALLRALMLDPPYLIMDEPLGSLDPVVRTNMQEELKRLFNTLGKTVLLVTHDLHEAAYFGHSITLMRKGSVEQQGTYQELSTQPETQFVRTFLQAQPEMDSL